MNFISLDILLEEARRTFKRFPGVLLTAIVGSLIAIWIVEYHGDDIELRLLMSVLLGIPLFLAMTFWRESRGFTSQKHVCIELGLGAALIGLHYVLTRNDVTGNYALRYFQLTLALHLSVAFIAWIGRPGTNGFWQLNKSIFLR